MALASTGCPAPIPVPGGAAACKLDSVVGSDAGGDPNLLGTSPAFNSGVDGGGPRGNQSLAAVLLWTA